MKRLVYLVFASFLLFSLSFTNPAFAAASKMYTWTPSNLYKTATGTAYSAQINIGTAVTVYSKSGSRYKVSTGGKTGYIAASNLTGTLIKRTVYLSSNLYTTASHTKYTGVVAVNKTVYIKESANGLSHVHVIGTNQNGWIYYSNFIKPSTKYTWILSNLYTSATGTSFNQTVNSGQAVLTFSQSNGRYLVKVGNSTGYIKAYNLTNTLTKKTVYVLSNLYTTSSHSQYTSVVPVGKTVYINESANGLSHVSVIGTNLNGWIYTSHFTKPSTPPSSGTPSTTTPSTTTPSSGTSNGTTPSSGTSNGTTPSSGTSSDTTQSSGATDETTLSNGTPSDTTPSSGTTSGTPSGTTPSSGTTSGTTPSTTAPSATSKGLDVSHYQSLTQTSFNNLKSEGYSFVILKATEGTTFTDPQFYTYYKFARNAGLSVHAYHMIGNSTTTAAQQIAEAQHFYNVLSQTMTKTGYPFIGYAFEDVERTSSNGITTTWWQNYAPVSVGYFLNELQVLGQTKVGMYASYWYWTTYLQNNTVTWPSNTKIWLARYNITLGTNADVWQYTSTGTIEGISGYVDLDISYDTDF